jgi:hypothetical protein
VNATPPPQHPDPGTGSGDRIEITASDLATPEVEQQVRALREAATPQLIRSVGTPQAPTPGAWWRGNLVTNTFAGLLGGLAGFVLSEVVMGGDGAERVIVDDVNMHVAIWMTLVALGISALLSGWEGIEARNGQKLLQAWKVGLPVTAVGGFVGGMIAQVLYGNFFDRALERAMRASSDSEAFEIMESALRVPRAIAFLVAGAIVGVALGVASGAKQKAINGAIGGAIGGFIGGFLFSFVTSSGAVARTVTLCVTGAAIGGAIGLIEQARKEVWLEIVNGGMAGKQFILYHDSTTIGSAPGCHVTLIKDPHIAPHHATIVRGPSGPEIQAADPSVGVLVNGQPVQRAPIASGDQVQVGTTLLRLGLREQGTPTIAGMPPR